MVKNLPLPPYLSSAIFTLFASDCTCFRCLAETIDYGPYGFMERFDPNFTPNTSDLDGATPSAFLTFADLRPCVPSLPRFAPGTATFCRRDLPAVTHRQQSDDITAQAAAMRSVSSRRCATGTCCSWVQRSCELTSWTRCGAFPIPFHFVFGRAFAIGDGTAVAVHCGMRQTC